MKLLKLLDGAFEKIRAGNMKAGIAWLQALDMPVLHTREYQPPYLCAGCSIHLATWGAVSCDSDDLES